MESESLRDVARRLGPIAAEGAAKSQGGISPDGVSHLKWTFIQELEPLPEPEDLWIAPTGAWWLTADDERGDGLLVQVTVGAEANPENEARPSGMLEASSWPVPDRAWRVGLNSKYRTLNQDYGRLTTQWRFSYGGDEVLALEGTRNFEIQFRSETPDPAEQFARKLASRVGWQVADLK